MDPIEGHKFMACGQTHGPDLNSKGNGHGAFSLGLQWNQEKNTM